MMICDADFDELFPWTSPVKRPAPPAEKPVWQGAIRPVRGSDDGASLSRWEDDGGRTRGRRMVGFLDGRGIGTIDKWLKKGDYAEFDVGDWHMQLTPPELAPRRRR